MLFSDLKGRKLVSTTTADTIGKVKGFLVDPATKSIVALEFKKTPHGEVVAWRDLAAVGADAVTVAGDEVIVEATSETTAPFAGKDQAVLKKRVLTRAGEDLGSVSDVDFDPATGLVVSLVLGKDASVDGDRLLGVGSYAIVVS